MQRLLREKSEDVVKIKQVSENNKLPFGILSEGPKAIEYFINAKQADLSNEKRPG